MCAVLVLHILRVDEPEEGFVDERSGLEGMLFPLPSQAPARYTFQLSMQDRQELVERAGIASGPRF